VKEHDDFLLQAFAQVTDEITIVTPWLIYEKIEQTGMLQAMAQACQRGIKVSVVTDKQCNIDDSDNKKREEKQQTLNQALARLQSLGVTTQLVSRVHSKIVMGDTTLLCVGSFNWFSASRDIRFERYDTSLVY
jgi:phosphatidylserine/phosphatidylglycerophosphate/cardiolipin synthase-like enzyme